MNVIRWMAALLLLVVVAGGCERRASTRDLEREFAKADPAVKATVDKIVASLKAGDHAAALKEIDKIVLRPKLTDAQRQALCDSISEATELLKQDRARLTNAPPPAPNKPGAPAKNDAPAKPAGK